MSGNNPNLSYALNVLGNATVQGILDCTEVAIDNVFTENVEADSVKVSSLTASRPVFTDSDKKLISTTATGTGAVVLSSSPTLITPSITGTITQSVSGAGGAVANLMYPSATSEVFLAVGANNAALDQAVVLTYDPVNTRGELSLAGRSPSLEFNGANGDVFVRGKSSSETCNISSLTASLPVSTDGSKNLVSASVTGTGSTVLQTSPTLITPSITGTITQSVSGAGGAVANLMYPSATSEVFLAVGANNAALDQAVVLTYDPVNTRGELSLAGRSPSLEFNGANGDVFVRGKLIIGTPSCYTYYATSTTAISGVPTNMLHWIPNPAAANSGDQLTYDNVTGRFTNSLGRTVLAIITATARTDVVVGTLTATLLSSSLSGAASVSTVTMGDFVSLSASIVMGNGAYFSLQGITTNPATWQSLASCITISLF